MKVLLCIIQKLVLEKEKTEDPIGETNYNNYNRQIKKFPTEKQNVSLKHILT